MKAITLCYHKVGTQEEQGRRLNIHPLRLRSHIDFFVRRKYEFKRAGEYEPDSRAREVFFTFDDAYESTLKNGIPIFDELSLPATLYVVPSLVGESSVWEGQASRPLADWGHLEAAYRKGHEIGNHTRTHPRLATLKPEEQLEEIRKAHEELIARGFEPGSFCYPYGSLNPTAIDAVAVCGYRVGMALGKRPPKASDNRLAVPRIVVAYSDSLPKLLYKIHVRPLLPKKKSR